MASEVLTHTPRAAYASKDNIAIPQESRAGETENQHITRGASELDERFNITSHQGHGTTKSGQPLNVSKT